MDKTTFKNIDPQLDEIADCVDQVLHSTELARLRGLLAALNTRLGERYSASLGITVDVCDQEKERVMPLLQLGLAGFDDDPYHATGDSTIQSYVADGEIQVVPHDRWSFVDARFDYSMSMAPKGHANLRK